MFSVYTTVCIRSSVVFNDKAGFDYRISERVESGLRLIQVHVGGYYLRPKEGLHYEV